MCICAAYHFSLRRGQINIALLDTLSVHCQPPSPCTVSLPLRALSATLSVDTVKDANVAEKIHEKETLAVANNSFR